MRLFRNRRTKIVGGVHRASGANESERKLHYKSRFKVGLRLLVFPALLICSTRSLADHLEAISVPAMTVSDFAFSVDKWLVIGPIVRENPLEALRTNLLPIADTAITKQSFESIAAMENGGGAGHGGMQGRTIEGSEVIDFLQLYGVRPSAETRPVAFYAACEILSAERRAVFFQIGTDESFRLWVNGDQVATFEGTRTITLFDDFARVQLSPGRNLIIIKVVSRAYGAGFAIRCEPSANDACATALAGHGRFLDRLICEEGSSPKISIPGAPPGQHLVIEVTPPGESGGQQRSLIHGPDSVAATLRHGTYEAKCEFGGKVYRQRFLIGEPEKLWEALQTRAKMVEADVRAEDDFRGLDTRMSILLSPAHRQPTDLGWQAKIVFTLSEIEALVRGLENNTGPYSAPGLHLRSFRSKIDGGTYYYRIFIPMDSGRKPRPLLVMLPPPISGSREFLVSPFVANHEDAVEIARLADRYHVAVLWPGYPCKPYGHPREFTYFDEVMEAVERDLAIDMDRVSLAGTCSSGVTASMSAVLWPNRFASIWLINPHFHKKTNRLEDKVGDGMTLTAGYKKALADADPMFLLSKINLPINIDHDGGDPGHGELFNTLEYLSLAAQSGIFPSVTLHARSVYPNTSREAAIAWISRQRRTHASSERSSFLFKPNAIGPINRVLSEKFVVIVGTSAKTSEENDAGRRLAREFAQGWQKSFFVDCKIIEDRDVEAGSITDHVVLIGNAETNALWKRWIKPEEIKLKSTEITVRGRKYTGTDLGIQAVLPNPEVQGRKIILVGSCNLVAARFGTWELGIDGWFDFAVWRPGKTDAELVDVGRY